MSGFASNTISNTIFFSAIGYYYWNNRYIIVESDISSKLQF